MRPEQNPKIPEYINTTKEHPLKEFGILLVGLTVVLIISVFVFSFFVEKFASYIPFKWEQRITESYERVFVKGEEQSSTDSSLTQAYTQAEDAIIKLGNDLIQNSSLPKDITVTFHLMENDAPNAFATLGGHVFVTTGLLQSVNSENALAMVLAHEIAHVKFRHPIKALSRGALFQLVFSVVFGSQDGASLQNILGNTGLLTMLSFNRDMERESDKEALEVLVKKYGHLRGADEFFKAMMQQVGTTDWQEVFQTHPGVESRIEKIEMQALTVDSSNAELNPLDPRLIELRKLLND